VNSGVLANEFIHGAPLSGAPQAFEVVKLPSPGRENMNDEIDVVQKDPLSFFVSFNVKRASSQFTELLIDTFGDGLTVTAGSTGADDEVIGE
jgi:hypothetical protein